MDIQRINKLLGQKEGIRLEFKQASTETLPKNLFESICAMLNREGGDIFLGVHDNGTITGINPAHIDQLSKDLVNLSNNPSKIDPPFILHPQLYEIDGKSILHIIVPESSELHRCINFVYDRGHDGDFKVVQPSQIAVLYNRKHVYYSEGTVYPGIEFSDFKPELFTFVRNIIKIRTPNHPWLHLDDEQFLKIAGLYGKDPITKKEGYNLAAVLLFGTDQTILNVVPYFKIDALVRRDDLDRYDDRLYIQTNLIEAYDLLMSFVEKHLPDKFFLRGDQSISLRAHIFREVVANLIIHREYRNRNDATFIIYKDKVEVKNANTPRTNGLLLPDSFKPHTKNPILAKFFIQLGRVDQLGSGILNVFKFLKHYSPGRDAEFVEDDMFQTMIPVGREASRAINNDDAISNVINDAINDAINDSIISAINIQLQKRLINELKMINSNGGIILNQIVEVFGVKRATAQRDMKLLKDIGYVDFIGANKNGKYVLTEIGEKLFHLE